jgi:hypothetical protein
MIVLTVYREWESAYNQRTILKDSNGKIRAIISSSLRQPKRGQKEITINCFKYALNWQNVPSKYVKVKDRIINN